MCVRDPGPSYLRAKYFVLTIRRQSLTDQMIAHMEPRQYEVRTAVIMPLDDWQNLYFHGHSFSLAGIAQCLLNDAPPVTPPPDMVTGSLDGQLRASVVDATVVATLEDRLRTSLQECYQLWFLCIQDAIQNRRAYSLHADMNWRVELRRYDDNGDLMQGRVQDMNTANTIRDLFGHVNNELKGIKSQLIDHKATSLGDTLELVDMALKTPKELAEFTYWYQSQRYEETMRWHNTIIAFSWALCLMKRIDKGLSSRGTGDTLLLADPNIHRSWPESCFQDSGCTGIT